MPTSKRGFASLSKAKRRAIAGRGGKAAQALGRAHQWTREDASRAGRTGGQHPKKRLSAYTSAKRFRSNVHSGMEQEYVTPHEAATKLRVSYRTVRRWIRDGILPVETIQEGRRNRHHIKKATLETLETPSTPPGFV